LLRDPAHDDLKDDVQLCRVLTTSLRQNNEQVDRDRAVGQREDEELVGFRAFLCRALGQFRLRDGLPVLLECAAIDTARLPPTSREAEVRLAALEAIASLAENLGSQAILSEPGAVEVLVTASGHNGAASPTCSPSDIASAATFALGVLGGSPATQRLIELLNDARCDVRYNAATGLARHGHAEAVPVLLEMLNPENRAALQYEKTESARTRKQAMVLSTAIRAAERLLPDLSREHRQQLMGALQQLCRSKTLASRVRLDAKQVVLKLTETQ
jgi:HEAT repeat protein